MDKKTKELLRKRKKVRPASSSESSSSSDSDSGSSSDSYSSSSSADKKSRHHRSKKGRPRRSSSSSDDEKARKREKHACHRKAEAKRSHLKRKQREAKAKKRALSPATLEKRHHHHQMLKERHQMREREKLRLAHQSSKELLLKARLSPSKAKLERHHHHQLSPREKIIIRRERSPPIQQILSPQRGPKDIRHRLEDRRSERERMEAARQKEREEALARCQERQRERERIAKEKLRRERQEKEYDPREQRLLPRASERELAIAVARGQEIRERSVETHPDDRRSAHSHSAHRLPHAYERSETDYDRDYEMRHPTEHERHGSEIDRDYLMMRRRGSPSPGGHYKESRIRGSDRELYPEDERYERGTYPQSRSSRGGGTYAEEIPLRRERENEEWEHERGEAIVSQDLREHHTRPEKLLYEKHRNTQSPQWEENNWKYQQQQHLKFGARKKIPPQMQEENWDEEVDYRPPSKKPTTGEWVEGPPHHHVPPQSGRMKMEHGPPMKMVEGKIPHEVPPHVHPGVHIVQLPPTHSTSHPVPHVGPPVTHPPHGKRWPQQEWRPRAPPPHGVDLRPMHPSGPPGPRVPGYRAPMHRHPVGPMAYSGQERPHYPPRHAPPHIQQQHHLGSPYHPRQHFPPKRQMVYTNPNIIASQKAAAQAAPPKIKPTSALVPIKLMQTSPPFIVNPMNKIALIKKIEEQKEQEKQSTSNEAATASENFDSGADEMEPGEIKSTNENEGIEPSEEPSAEGTFRAEGETRDDLSEISDEAADDILKIEKLRQAAALAGDKLTDGAKDDTNIELDNQGDQTENDDLLDFEEISDGELEEETRKNLGDALGVDWASLIKESKIVKGNQKDKNTTAKQKWQPHRVILDVGISMKYAGKQFAEDLIKNAQLMLEAENATKKIEKDVKDEIKIKNEEETTIIKTEKDDPEFNEDDAKKPIETIIKIECQSEDEVKKSTDTDITDSDETNKIPIENLSELACVQVAQRKNKEIQNNLVFNACGINSRALSARKDLRLRRQLCGLPVKELECGRVVSDQMKSLALKAFQKAVGEVK